MVDRDRSGRVLDETPVELVQFVENVPWEDHRVVIEPVADRPLPYRSCAALVREPESKTPRSCEAF